MQMLPAEVIKKKRQGEVHSREELAFLVSGYTSGQIPDYQMAAWLMAAWIRGLNRQEAAWLTELMKTSGKVLDFSDLHLPIVDKHSTGGVGDKTSLILAPMAAAAGIHVPMMAGRGLGHTGGTLDKLEAIEGFNVRLSLEQFQAQVRKFGTAIVGQTKEICPADLKLYSLRDVTATVDSIPLICASIMSKKLAEGLTALVLDVKFGSGAFMKTLDSAIELARALGEIGALQGLKVHALITNMNQPLGRYIGNSLEVKECLDIMDNQPSVVKGVDLYADTRGLTLKLGGHMIYLGGKASSVEAGQAVAESLLKSGAVKAKFLELVKIQGGKLPIQLPTAKFSQVIVAKASGLVSAFECEKMGLAAIGLGAGRGKSEDQIDHSAGLEVLVKLGQPVEKGQALCTAFAASQEKILNVIDTLSDAIKIADRTKNSYPLIAKELTFPAQQEN